MAEFFLVPEDVRPAHAQQVLDYLNRATSTQQIADAIEFPEQPDIGLRLAQRILSRRAELNGFRSLDQVYAVPLIGPKRFTQIVLALSEARPPRLDMGAALNDLAEVRQRVDALHALLEPAVQARLWSVQSSVGLGQRATLLVQVLGAGGRPLVDQPLTLTTTWGELTASCGVKTLTGVTVLTRSNELGLAEIQLGPRFQAPLSAAQRLALELAAALLPEKAAWPTAARAELSELIRRYRAATGSDLREAIDAAYREYGASLQQAEHRGQALAEWMLLPVTVVCHVNDAADERGQKHLALATHTLFVRNWLPAFIAAFEKEVAADTALGAELERAPREVDSAGRFLNDVFISVESILNTERGALGRTIRNRAAQGELQRFMQTQVASLSKDVRLSALNGVRNASKTIGDGGLTLFTAVETTRRADLSAIQAATAVVAAQVSAIENTVVTAAEVQDIKNQVAALSLGSDGLRQDFDSLSRNLSGLETKLTRDLAGVGTRLDGIDQRIGRG